MIPWKFGLVRVDGEPSRIRHIYTNDLESRIGIRCQEGWIDEPIEALEAEE